MYEYLQRIINDTFNDTLSHLTFTVFIPQTEKSNYFAPFTFSKCSVDDLDYGGGSLDPNALYKSRPLLTSTPKSTPTEEFFPKPFESDV